MFAEAIWGLVLAATPGPPQIESPELHVAVARLSRVRDAFQTNGQQPNPDELASIEQSLVAAADAATQRNDWVHVSEAFAQLNWAERMQGRWDSAIAYADKALGAARQGRSREHQARALLGRSKADLSRKDLTAAAEHAEAAVRLAEAVSDVKLRFDTLDNWSQVQVSLGQINAAAETLNRALVQPGLTDESLTYGYMDRADIYLKNAERCDYVPEYAICLQSVALSRADYQRAAAAAHRLGWAGIERQVQSFSKQLEVRALMISSREESSKTIGQMQFFHPTKPSDVLVTERFAPASDPRMAQLIAPVYRNAQNQQPKGFAAPSTARMHYIEGLMAQSQNDHAKALQWFQRAIEVLEKNEQVLPDDASRVAFFAEFFDMYVAAALELLDAKRYADAFAMLEKSRARAMADLLGHRRLDLGSGKENQLYAEQVEIEVQLTNRQAEVHRMLLDGSTQDDIGPVEKELADLREAHRRLQARTAAASARLHGLTAARPASLAEVQALAKRDHCEVLEYLVTETNLLIWYIGPSAVQVKNVFLPRAELQAAVQALQSQLANPASTFDRRQARALFLQLVQPIRPLLQGTRLLILPHDILNLVPFEVLEDPADQRPFGATFDVAYAPSATIYKGIRTWLPGGKKRALVVADPKLEAEQDGHEGQRVAAVYRAGAVEPTLDFLGKSALKQAVADVDVVHLSVHGHFDGENPLLSYVALADGHLTAAESFGLPLAKASLVVLSACESGKLSVTRGNEELGMVRGLLYAGAGALLLSRWEVSPPATALWMETFHREARQRGLPAAARLAAKAVREDPRYAHPNYWAAFSLMAR